MHPIEIVIHAGRTETDRIPLPEDPVDFRDLFQELFPGVVQSAVVMQAVKPDLETSGSESLPDLGRHDILACHKIEHGPKTELLLEVGKLQAIIKAFL
jgi:hypothetical protein